jgi:hypothetical protein
VSFRGSGGEGLMRKQPAQIVKRSLPDGRVGDQVGEFGGWNEATPETNGLFDHERGRLDGERREGKKTEFNPLDHPMKLIGGRKSLHAAERLKNSR